MRVTLIHNPTAGNGDLDAEAIVRCIRELGHDVRYQSRKASHFPLALREPADVIAVAGGDGTVAKVAKHLTPSCPPLAILPMGKANNIASSLKIEGTLQQIVSRWRSGPGRSLDCWQASGPWGDRFILEGTGVGALADNIAKLRAQKAGPSMPKARAALRKRLKAKAARHLTLRLDGRHIEGRFLLLEMLNFSHIGPRLNLAPGADPFDGQLDIVLVRESAAEVFADWIESESSLAPPADVHRGRAAECLWDTGSAHLDDKVWCSTPEKPRLKLEMRYLRSVRLLSPA